MFYEYYAVTCNLHTKVGKVGENGKQKRRDIYIKKEPTTNRSVPFLFVNKSNSFTSPEQYRNSNR